MNEINQRIIRSEKLPSYDILVLPKRPRGRYASARRSPYSEKRNLANGHDNMDGAHEYSGNCGWEDEEGVPPEVLRLRK